MPELLALEGMEGTFDHPLKAQKSGGYQSRRLTQILEQTLLEQGKLLACHHRELIAGGLQDLQGMDETKLVGVQLGEASPIDASTSVRRSAKGASSRVPDRPRAGPGYAKAARLLR